MATAIQVESLSKAYQLGEIGTGTLSRDLERWLAKIRGREDPFLKIGEANDRTSKGSSDVVWSLKDVSYSIEQGDAVGIIGRNGAGKSTLLKLLSRVTSPTLGSIKVKGRIASLLEVGTGFHPELTGKENIYLNGAILGMRKREIARKFDEIVEFAGVERYIDTPVKRYSSGMYVRLAFAVAAHLESEILIVDEVLAVGDAEFQKKCLGKMGEVSKGEGRTVLFVSHNMGSIENLCNKGLLLQYGQISFQGDSATAIKKYTLLNKDRSKEFKENADSDIKDFFLTGLSIVDSNDEKVSLLKVGDNYSFLLRLKRKNYDLRRVRVILGVYNEVAEGIMRFDSNYMDIGTQEKEFSVKCTLATELYLKPGLYYMNVAVYSEKALEYYASERVFFEIDNIDYSLYNIDSGGVGLIKVLSKTNWNVE